MADVYQVRWDVIGKGVQLYENASLEKVQRKARDVSKGGKKADVGLFVGDEETPRQIWTYVDGKFQPADATDQEPEAPKEEEKKAEPKAKKEKAAKAPPAPKPAKEKAAPKVTRTPQSFGINTNRAKLFAAMIAQPGKLIPAAELAGVVYGDPDTKHRGKLQMVINGIAYVIDEKELPFKVLKERKGKEMSFGILPTNE